MGKYEEARELQFQKVGCRTKTVSSLTEKTTKLGRRSDPISRVHRFDLFRLWVMVMGVDAGVGVGVFVGVAVAVAVAMAVAVALVVAAASPW